MIERPMTLLLCAESLRRIEGELVRSRSIYTVVSSKYTGLSPWPHLERSNSFACRIRGADCKSGNMARQRSSERSAMLV